VEIIKFLTRRFEGAKEKTMFSKRSPGEEKWGRYGCVKGVRDDGGTTS